MLKLINENYGVGINCEYTLEKFYKGNREDLQTFIADILFSLGDEAYCSEDNLVPYDKNNAKEFTIFSDEEPICIYYYNEDENYFFGRFI